MKYIFSSLRKRKSNNALFALEVVGESQRKLKQNNKLLCFPIDSHIPQNPLNLHAFAYKK